MDKTDTFGLFYCFLVGLSSAMFIFGLVMHRGWCGVGPPDRGKKEKKGLQPLFLTLLSGWFLLVTSIDHEQKKFLSQMLH